MNDNEKQSEPSIMELRRREFMAHQRRLDENTNAIKLQAQTMKGFIEAQEKAVEQSKSREARAFELLRCIVSGAGFDSRQKTTDVVKMAFSLADEFISELTPTPNQ